MKTLTDILNEGIISKTGNPNIDEITKWIKENYKCPGLKISDNPNSNGLYEAIATDVYVTNKSITSLTNGMFEWVRVKSFNCSDCKYLESLEGSPKKVRLMFDCKFCTSLKSLEGVPQEVESINCRGCKSLISLNGSPKKVDGNFICFDCDSLTSLEGAPEEVGGKFSCSFCVSLKSLKGAPKKVGGDFSCSKCSSLISLEGAPIEVGGDFYCWDCAIKCTPYKVRKVTKVNGTVENNL